ncbi:MAG: TspO/MBR family protein [Pseudomonadota bacterium]
MSLLIFVGLNLITAISGGYFTPGQWYEDLKKPTWQPPKWAFPVVWTILYVLNAIAGWIVWASVGFSGLGMVAMIVYVGSLALNAAWSWLFFGKKDMRLALWEAVALWLSVALQILLFYQIDPLAGLILIPYLCWVSVAVFLNKTLIRLNPSLA